MSPSHQKFLLRLSALSKKLQRQSSKIACESEAERGRVTEKMLRMPLEKKRHCFSHISYWVIRRRRKCSESTQRWEWEPEGEREEKTLSLNFKIINRCKIVVGRHIFIFSCATNISSSFHFFRKSRESEKCAREKIGTWKILFSVLKVHLCVFFAIVRVAPRKYY